MSAYACLRAARVLVEKGWNEPMCVDAGGVWVSCDSPAVDRYSVTGALSLSATDDPEYRDALAALELIATPNMVAAFGPSTDAAAWAASCRAAAKDSLFEDWLQHPQRKLEHVLRCFDLAILGAQRREAA